MQAVKCGYLYLLLAKDNNANLKFWLFVIIVEAQDASHKVKVCLLIFNYVCKDENSSVI